MEDSTELPPTQVCLRQTCIKPSDKAPSPQNQFGIPKGGSPLAGREGVGGFKGGANSENWFYRFNLVCRPLAVLQLQNCRKWYFKDEGEHLKSSFSSFRIVKTAAGGKPVTPKFEF